MPINRVREFLKRNDEQLQPIVFDHMMKTSEEAARVLGVEIGQIAKSILFRSNEGNYGLFVVAGDLKVNSKKVKTLIGGRKQRMATPEEVEEITGFQPGAVCPFALLKNVPIYIDESMQRFDVVYTAAGIPESLLPISYEKLVGITKGIAINVSRED